MRQLESAEFQEEHFTEGEPDLEPPEELALSELEDENLLEEELDNDDIAEEEVDEVTLELTLEDLVHQSDSDDDGENEVVITVRLASDLQEALADRAHRNGSSPVAGARTAAPLTSNGADDDADETEDLEIDDLEDVEESLDRILAERMAGDSEPTVDDEEDGSEESVVDLEVSRFRHPAGTLAMHRARARRAEVSGRNDDEFVCVGCFLVKKRAQLTADGSNLCRDCC